MKTKLYRLIGLLFVFLVVSPPAHAREIVNILDVKNDATLNYAADPALASFYVVDPALESFKSLIRFRFEEESKDRVNLQSTTKPDWSKVGLELAFADCSDAAAHGGRTLRINIAEGAFSKADDSLYVANPAHIDVILVERDGRIRRLNPQLYSLKARIMEKSESDGAYLAELAWDRGVSDQSDLPSPSSVAASLKVKGNMSHSKTIAGSTRQACVASVTRRSY